MALNSWMFYCWLRENNNEPRGSGFFAYLAFDDESWDLLAHGRTAALALQEAEEIVPHTAIRVILAAPFGRTIWDRGVQLYLAERALRRARDALEQLRSGRLSSKGRKELALNASGCCRKPRPIDLTEDGYILL